MFTFPVSKNGVDFLLPAVVGYLSQLILQQEHRLFLTAADATRGHVESSPLRPFFNSRDPIGRVAWLIANDEGWAGEGVIDLTMRPKGFDNPAYLVLHVSLKLDGKPERSETRGLIDANQLLNGPVAEMIAEVLAAG